MNRDAAAAAGTSLDLKLLISDLGDRLGIKTFWRFKFLNGGKKK